MKMKCFVSVIVLALFFLEQAGAQTENNSSVSKTTLLKRGFRNTIDIGVGINPNPSGKYGSGSITASYQKGFQFSQGVFTGLELGYQHYGKPSIFHHFPPHLFLLGLPVEYLFKKEKTAPYIGTYVGVSYNLNDKFKPIGNSGRLIGGFRTALSERLALRYGLAYEFHSFTIVEHDPSINWTGQATRKRHNIRIHLGVQF